MSQENPEEKLLLPHHEQQELCTTRLPYRQGRKLTAVKTYTITRESNHLLIFGVPSLKLHKEAKSMLAKFGKLLQFSTTTKYPTEAFTENFHAIFESIQSARIAKRMLDTKNFYGGSLHICYAPELEDIAETRTKLFLRQRDVLNRLRNLKSEATVVQEKEEPTIKEPTENIKLNMGDVNIIGVGKQIRDVVYSNKRKLEPSQITIEKKFKPCFIEKAQEPTTIGRKIYIGRNRNNNGSNQDNNSRNKNNCNKSNGNICNEEEIEIIDFTSTETNTITNVNDNLNYNNYGGEVIKKVQEKPVNKIKFIIGNKKSQS